MNEKHEKRITIIIVATLEIRDSRQGRGKEREKEKRREHIKNDLGISYAHKIL